MSDDDAEYIIGDDSSSTPDFSPGAPAPLPESVLTLAVELCQQVLPTFRFEQRGYDRLLISVPSSILPLSLSVVNQFHNDPVLVNVDLTLTTNSFRGRAHVNDVSNPYLGPSFGGRALVVDRIASFFSPNFRPRGDYRCKLYVLVPVGTASDRSIAQLVQEGFAPDAARRALVLAQGNVRAAAEFLMTGAASFRTPDMLYSYGDCPLVYLLFEICEAFFDLVDHCCICGGDLGVQGVKLSLCNKPVCLFGFRDIGIGASVVAELGRDPAAADLVISLASVSANPWGQMAAMKEASADLPVSLLQKNPEFWKRLPAVGPMAAMGTDANLVQAEYIIGDDSSSTPEFSPGAPAPLPASVLTLAVELCQQVLPTFRFGQRGYDRLLNYALRVYVVHLRNRLDRRSLRPTSTTATTGDQLELNWRSTASAR